MGCACMISNRHGEGRCELPFVGSRLVEFHSAGEGPKHRPTAHSEDAVSQHSCVSSSRLQPAGGARVGAEHRGQQQMA